MLPSEAEGTIKSIKDWVLDKIDSFVGEPITEDTKAKVEALQNDFEDLLRTKHINDLDNSPVCNELMLLVSQEIRNARESIRTILYQINCELLKDHEYEEWGKKQTIKAYKLWTGKEPENDRTNNTTELS